MRSNLTFMTLCGFLAATTFAGFGCNTSPPAPTVKVANHDSHGSARAREEAEKNKKGRPKGHAASGSGPSSAPAGGHKAK